MHFSLRILVGIILASFCEATAVRADIINFDDLPDASIANKGGGDIGTFYLLTKGVTFGSGVTGLDTTIAPYDPVAFPPHSSPIVAFTPSADAIIAFATPQTDVSFFYTSIDVLTLMAFDAANNSLGSIGGSANTDGATGTSDPLSVHAAGISSVEISSPGGSFVFDDLAFSASVVSAVPEPGTAYLLGVVLILFGLGLKVGIRKIAPLRTEYNRG